MLRAPLAGGVPVWESRRMEKPSQSTFELSSVAMATKSGSCITVVIPCFNAKEWVARTIRSVLDQTGVEVEVIVIDNGSTDGSLDGIKTFENSTRLETSSIRGACAARNRGLELAASEYVMFLDADDYIEGPLLRGLVERLAETQVDLVIGPCAEASPENEPKMRTRPRTETGQALIVDWLKRQWIPPCALAWRRSSVLALGGWRTDLLRNQDGELVMRAALRNYRFATSDIGRGIYWQHSSTKRISRIASDESLASALMVLRELVDEIGPALDESIELRSALSFASHELERNAAINGLPNILSEIQNFRDGLGFHPYYDSIGHAVVTSVLGLRRKERLTRWLSAKWRKLKTISAS
jgi:glycosyltransferase involved in cell wall biosynthesis